jgi:5-methylcytosine-specific restriction endonuclease McrA
MIKIKLSEEIKDLHWEWYEYYLENKKIPLKHNLPDGKKSVLSFLKDALGWDKAVIKKIVLAEPVELHSFANKDSEIFIHYDDTKVEKRYEIKKRGWSDDKVEKWTVEKILKEYFGYDDFEKGCIQNEDVDKDECENKTKWSAYTFTRMLNIDVCPYCGRQYVFTISDGNGRPQIDHYYPQSEYPFLSCSLYNFIPSCPQCNHQKGDVLNKYATKTERTKHDKYDYDQEGRAFVPYPYEDAFEIKNDDGVIEKDAWFSVLYGNLKDDISLEDSVCVKIKHKSNLPCDKERKIKNAIEAFHLNELYSCQKIELNDLFARYRHYCKPKIDEIISLVLKVQLGTYYNGNLNSIVAKAYTRRIKNIILGKPLNIRDKQYPLRKFKEDVIEQLDKTYKTMGK